MKEVSFYTHVGGADTSQGYGYAGLNIVNALNNLGYKTPFNDENSPIQLNFTQPWYYQIESESRKNQLKIGYTPWESTKLWETWPDYMNACDEVWATNQFCADVFKAEGVTKPIYVYEHGIEPVWTPLKRSAKNTIKFLHVGEPAMRKNGQMVYDAFEELFGNNPDYFLTIKANGFSTIRYDKNGIYDEPINRTHNMQIITEVLDIEDLINLYHNHHILVYPSHGEGFGFIPIQAMATGMPVILNPSWASYKRFVTTQAVTDSLEDSPWPDTHPGQMYKPDYESLKLSMLDAVDRFSEISSESYRMSPLIHAQYSWEKVTKKAFQRF